MSSELAINSSSNGERIVLLQNKKIVEYHVEERDNNFTVGDVFFGVIRKVVPGLNAAFIDIGYEKDAFLHYHDLGANFNTFNKFIKQVIAKKNIPYRLQNLKFLPQINKLGSVSQVLHKNRPILVQIVKEPISTKGPRLSSEISLPGRFLILVPFANSVNVSKKIVSKEERQRLSKLITSMKPKGFGIIIRTASEGQAAAELYKDMEGLLEKWEEGMKVLKDAKPRQKVISEGSRTSTILRDLLNDKFDSITVDNKDVYEEVNSYIREIAPEKQKIVKLYNNKVKLFENLGIEKQLKHIFGRSVNLDNGGYLIIEHTEALHVIDVNSGNKSTSEKDQETTALNVNLQAAEEIARQLRIRDMGGIIIVDFIDMKKYENKNLLFKKMKDELKKDRTKSSVLPLTKFGLMQITRERIRPEINIKTSEQCSSCDGTGKVAASILITDEIESHIDFLLNKQNEKSLKLYLHPYLEAFFTKGMISKQRKWYLKYKRWVKLIPDSSLPLNKFRFENKQGEEIEVNPA